MKPDPFSLDRLQDIVTGPSVTLWPPAPAWYFVLAVIAIQLFVLAAGFVNAYRANAYRRQALRELTDLRVGDAWGLSVLLKRVALVAYPREEVASLTGENWVAFLTEAVSGVTFASGAQSPLESAAIHSNQQSCTAELWNKLTSDAHRWIRMHKQGASA